MHDSRLSAAEVWLRLGRLVEAVALAMRKHTMVPGLGVCACGRLPERELAMFGARCDVACDTWERAHHGMRIVLDQVDPATFTDGSASRAVGRAVVPVKRRTPDVPRPIASAAVSGGGAATGGGAGASTVDGAAVPNWDSRDAAS